MKNLFFVVATGSDCDGYYASNRLVATFHSKKVAEKMYESTNMASDGILYAVIDSQTFDEYYKEAKQNAYYMPFIGSPYFENTGSCK